MTKEARIYNGERTASSINGVGKLDIYMQKNETGPLSYTIHKINSKLIEDLNIRPETIRHLEENTGSKLLDISLGDDFLDLTSNDQVTKTKIHIHLKSFCRAKETTNRMKRQPT